MLVLWLSHRDPGVTVERHPAAPLAGMGKSIPSCQGEINRVFQPPPELRQGGIPSRGRKQGCFQPPPGQSAAAPRPWRGSQHQILQALHQVVGDVDLAAPFHLVPRHLRPQADDWRVRGAEGHALRHPQPGPEHDPHGHPHRVDGVCGYQRRGLLKSEVVGGFWGFLAMPPPIRGDCCNQSARRGRPGAMSPESAGGLGSWLVSEMPDFRNQCWSEHHPMVWCIGKVSLGVGRRWQFRQHFR